MSVHKTSNGRWKVRWRDPSKFDEQGRPLARSRTFDLKKDALNHDAKVRQALQRGETVEDRSTQAMTFNALADEWLRLDAAPRLSAKTINGYLGFLKILRPIIGTDVIQRIDAKRVLALRADVQSATPAYSAARTLKLFRQIMAFAVDLGYVGANPADILRRRGALPPQSRKKDVRPLSPEQIEATRAAMLARRTPHALRDAALVSVLGYAGLRPEEALALSWEHVGADLIKVERANRDGDPTAPTKNGKSRTVRPLAGELVDDLNALRDSAPDPALTALVFPNADGEAWTRTDYQNWRRRTWAPSAPEGFSPYSARHGHASLLIRAGWDVVRVAKRLGHSPVMCLSHYAHVFEEFEGDEPVSMEDAIASARANAGCPVSVLAVD